MAIGLIRQVPPSRILAADAAYDSSALRAFLIERGTMPVIPNTATRKQPFPFDRTLYRRRNVIERTFSRLKDYRRIATRYDKLAATYDAAVCLAATVIW